MTPAPSGRRPDGSPDVSWDLDYVEPESQNICGHSFNKSLPGYSSYLQMIPEINNETKSEIILLRLIWNLTPSIMKIFPPDVSSPHGGAQIPSCCLLYVM